MENQSTFNDLTAHLRMLLQSESYSSSTVKDMDFILKAFTAYMNGSYQEHCNIKAFRSLHPQKNIIRTINLLIILLILFQYQLTNSFHMCRSYYVNTIFQPRHSYGNTILRYYFFAFFFAVLCMFLMLSKYSSSTGDKF